MLGRLRTVVYAAQAVLPAGFALLPQRDGIGRRTNGVGKAGPGIYGQKGEGSARGELEKRKAFCKKKARKGGKDAKHVAN